LCSERWSDKPAVSGRDRRPNLLDGRWTPSLACPAVCGSSALPSRLTAGGKRWPGFSSRQTAGTPPSPVPTRSSGLGRSAVSPAHHSGRRHRSLEPLPPCSPQRWAGGTPPAIWRSSRTPLGCVSSRGPTRSIATRWKGWLTGCSCMGACNFRVGVARAAHV
ncbi:hypothetical protein T03_14643, partial [Trichinella britovi]